MKQTVLLEDQDWTEMRQGEMRQIVVSPGTTSLLVGYFSSRPRRGTPSPDAPRNGLRRHTPDEKRAAVARVAKGESRSVVAESIGVVPSLVSAWVLDKRWSAPASDTLKPLPWKKGQRRIYSPEYKAAVLARIKGGARVFEIAKELKIDRAVIDKWRRQ